MGCSRLIVDATSKLNMVQKRPFNEDESNEVPAKQPRQIELDSRLVSALEFPSEHMVHSCHTSGEDDDNSTKTKLETDNKIDVGCIMELPTCTNKDAETRHPDSLPSSSMFGASVNEEDMRTEASVHITLSPDHNFEHQPRTIIHPVEIYSFLLDHPPRKIVPVGQGYQADIPEWGAHFCSKTSTCSERTEIPTPVSQPLRSDEERLAGTFVIPMLYSELADTAEVGAGKKDCTCEDEGSIRCVQQHIIEAREKLRGTLGPETFSDLGFCDVGEIVAKKWSEEEEKSFHQVICSNPSLLGKNFWKHLAVAFPSRSKMEIVSYYFNVYMLERRAEQNRIAPLNIDSDDDEWAVTEYSADTKVQNVEDDDSVAESPMDPDDKEIIHVHTSSIHHDDDDDMQSGPIDCRVVDFGHNNLDLPDGNFSHRRGSYDAQGACTPGDVGPSSRVAKDIADTQKQWTGQISGTSGINGHEFMAEACNTREWDFGFLNCPRNEVELLPTCNVIEEVFGAGSWDGQGLN